MSVTIPAIATSTFRTIMGAIAGEDYSYFIFDIKSVNPSERATIKVKMQISIPLQERSTAVHNVQGSLDSSDVLSVVKDEKQLDVFLPGEDESGKRIRIMFNAGDNKGSGGGAAATKIQEAAQCVYAAMRYYCGNIEYFDEDSLKCGMEHTVAPGVTLEEIQGIPRIWQDSSWLGAQEIFKQIGGTGWTFVRGDKLVEKEISEAFKRVKGQTNLSSEDKWNPADIWMVKDKSKVAKKLSEEGTIDCLNNFIQQARVKSYSPSAKKFTGNSTDPANGDLVGISLKKIEGSATMKLINADDAATRKANESASYVKYSLIFDNKRKKDPYPMDVYFYYGTGLKDRFQARNFGGPTKGDWKLELDGITAKQGKIQGAVLRRLLDNADFNVSKLTEPNFNDCEPGKGGKKDTITNEIYNLLNEFSATNFTANPNTKNIIAARKKSWRYSKLAGLRMLKWLKDLPNGEADRAMKEIYLYASSQSDKSSVYYKLM